MHAKAPTVANGTPAVDNGFGNRIGGTRGPTLHWDLWLHQKLGHLDRKAIPKRGIDAKVAVSPAGSANGTSPAA
jgi:catalase